jgi:alkylated DNA repair dioxygenase AlkB
MQDLVRAFCVHDIGRGCTFSVGALPSQLVPCPVEFEKLWDLHPAEFHDIRIHGRAVKTPRWSQAYGKDYHYSGQVNKALPVAAEFERYFGWVRRHVDGRINALLVNWYDGTLGHYIGPHRDNRKYLIAGAPIVTISLGEERVFRLRPWPASLKGKAIDFAAKNGTVFVIPWETNQAFTHEVPTSKRMRGRRISVTLRAFVDDID